jgi:uncharacterized protein YuzB (UPF0349 family)
MSTAFITTNPAAPSKCIVCNVSAKANLKYLDFGVSFDYYGAITICELCMENVFNLFDRAPVAKDSNGENEQALMAQLAYAEKKIEVLENVVATYCVSISGKSDPQFELDSELQHSSDDNSDFEKFLNS